MLLPPSLFYITSFQSLAGLRMVVCFVRCFELLGNLLHPAAAKCSNPFLMDVAMNRNLRWRISPFVWSPMVCGVLACLACGAFFEPRLQAETAAPANAVSPTVTPPAGPQTEELTPRNLHVWGRFDAGTWKQVRIVTDTLNSRGQVVDTSTTDIKTTLLAPTPNG